MDAAHILARRSNELRGGVETFLTGIKAAGARDTVRAAARAGVSP